jgi:hypothetical protein
VRGLDRLDVLADGERVLIDLVLGVSPLEQERLDRLAVLVEGV